MSPEADRLYRALKRLPPRTEQALRLRFVDGLGDSECARRYSVTEDAWSVHLLRAATLFAEAVRDPEGPPLLLEPVPLDADVERHRAHALRAALAGEAPRPPAPPAPITPAAAPTAAERDAASADAAQHGPEREATSAAAARLAEPLWRLSANAAEVRVLTEARLREVLESPEYQRREQLRRAALLALIVLATWLWYRSPPHR
ncbi:MAG: hypothetical protein IRZ16_08330 [Myxococcaceae bacterium]|nr:hypothetical protein [Myxococcaceae bacterium]